MKLLITFILQLMLFTPFLVLANTNNNNDRKKIEFTTGNLSGKPQRNLIQPIECFYIDGELQFIILEDLGTIEIIVENIECGDIYQETISGTGAYFIYISNLHGTHIINVYTDSNSYYSQITL